MTSAAQGTGWLGFPVAGAGATRPAKKARAALEAAAGRWYTSTQTRRADRNEGGALARKMLLFQSWRNPWNAALRRLSAGACNRGIPLIRITRMSNAIARPAPAPLSRKARLLWTLGNVLMLVGLILLLYVGGVYAQADYDRYAARGDTPAPAPRPIASSAPDEPAPFVAPILGGGSADDGRVVGALPSASQAAHASTVARVSIPSIGVDSKVVEVGWDVEDQGGQQVAVWQVAEYAVGQHRGSSNPGEGGNVVLAGHVGGYGKVFKDLFYVKPGDQITLYSGGQQYIYVVQERLLLTEEGVSAEQHAANAQYIAPTDHEVVTLVTCWPPKGADRFTQRVVVRAVPFAGESPSSVQQSSWTAR